MIFPVISLDENDPELPAWLKKSSNKVTGGSSTFGALGASTSLSAGLNSEDLINPRSKWADRASEQLSLAASVNVDGEDITSLFPPCDPHEVFGEEIQVVFLPITPNETFLHSIACLFCRRFMK